MMRNYCFILSAIFILLSSCKEKDNDPISRFNKVFNIQSERLNVDTYKFTNYGKFLLFEKEQCIIKHSVNRESLIDKIYYNRDSLVSLIKWGQGPNESHNVLLMQKKDGNHYMMFDLRGKKSKLMDIDGKVIESSSLDEYYYSVIQTNSGYIAWNSQSKVNENKMFVQLDQNGMFVRTFGEFPKEDKFSMEVADPKSRMMAYQGKFVYNSKQDKIAYITSFGIIFEVYQLGESPHLIQKYHDAFPAYIPDSGPKHSSAIYKKENINGYTDICSTDQYIYTLYSGKTVKAASSQAILEAELTNHVLVYDWNGNCVCRFVTDKSLLSIDVSEDNRKLVALGWEDDFYLYSFDLSEANL